MAIPRGTTVGGGNLPTAEKLVGYGKAMNLWVKEHGKDAFTGTVVGQVVAGALSGGEKIVSFLS